MSDQERIKDSLDRVASVLEARPSQGKSTKSVECELTDGLKVVWRAGEFEFQVDHKKVMGGDETAPSPGAYARGALAACLAMGYAMTFARRVVPFSNLAVRVESDSDAGAAVGVGEEPPGFHALRYYVEVDSSADPKIVQEAIDEADARSTVLQAFIRPVPAQGYFQINSVAEAAD
jgi:uncharacterized OsmC-like protein